MGWDFCTKTNQKAAKNYFCRASEILKDCTEYKDKSAWDNDEWLSIESAKADNWNIKKGDTYVKISGKWDGDFSVFRARPDIDALCHKYGLYND